jgi:hypothetical protein
MRRTSSLRVKSNGLEGITLDNRSSPWQTATFRHSQCERRLSGLEWMLDRRDFARLHVAYCDFRVRLFGLQSRCGFDCNLLGLAIGARRAIDRDLIAGARRLALSSSLAPFLFKFARGCWWPPTREAVTSGGTPSTKTNLARAISAADTLMHSRKSRFATRLAIISSIERLNACRVISSMDP